MALAVFILNASVARGSEEFSLCADRRGSPVRDRQWATKASLVGASEVLKVLEQAIQAAAAIQDPTDKTCALVAIAVAQARAGENAAASRKLREAAQTILPVQNGRIMRTVADWQIMLGELPGALQTAAITKNESERDGILQRIATAQARAGDVSAARQTAADIKGGVQGGWARVAIATAQAQAGHVSEALRTARSLKDPYQKASALEEIAGAQGGKGDRGGAIRTLREASRVASALQDDGFFSKWSLLRGLARAQAKAGDIEGARRTVANQDPKNADDVFRTIVEVQLEARDVAGALRTAARIRDRSHRIYAQLTVAQAQVTAGDRAAAARTVARALRIASAIRDGFDRALMVERVAVEQAKMGNIEGAFQTIRLIQDDYPKANALGRVAAAQVAAGDPGAARRTLEEALRIASGIQEHLARADALQEIGAVTVKAGDGIGADRIFAQPIDAALADEDDIGRIKFLHELASQLAEAGNIGWALRAANAMPEHSRRTLAFGSIMIAQARAGDFAGAHDIAAGFVDESTRLRALRDLAEIQAEKGDVKEAMARAVKSAPPALKSASLVAIADGILNRLEEQQGQQLGIKSRRRSLDW